MIHPFCVTIYEHARFDAQATTTNEVFGVIFSYPIAFPKTWKKTLEKGHVDSSIERSGELDNMYTPNYTKCCKILYLLLTNGSVRQIGPMLA